MLPSRFETAAGIFSFLSDVWNLSHSHLIQNTVVKLIDLSLKNCDKNFNFLRVIVLQYHPLQFSLISLQYVCCLVICTLQNRACWSFFQNYSNKNKWQLYNSCMSKNFLYISSGFCWKSSFPHLNFSNTFVICTLQNVFVEVTS